MKALTLAISAVALVTGAVRAQVAPPPPVDTGYVEYHESPITLPLGIGFRVPTYDRINGLTLPWGPRLQLGEEMLVLDAVVSYRSNLGKLDPSLEGAAHPRDGDELKLFVGRATFTNDAWIRSDLSNSLAAFFVGSDARNYYRADRASLRYSHTLRTSALSLTPFVGGSIERDWSTGSFAPTKSPWSFFGRKGALRMRRPNPPVLEGRINSLVGGSLFELESGMLEGKLDVRIEHAFKAPGSCSVLVGALSGCPNAPFTQTTLHSRVAFPTFGAHTFEFKGHAVLTGTNIAPPQRFAYLGGAGTLATVDLLALGGDRLLYLQGDYIVPLKVLQLPFVGGPFVALRYAAGNAGLGSLPQLIQNIGVGAGIGPLRVDYSIDPARNRSPFSRRSAFSIGVSLSL